MKVMDMVLFKDISLIDNGARVTDRCYRAIP